MLLKSAYPISSDKKRIGTILAFFRSLKNSDIYFASAGHVIKLEHSHPSKTAIFCENRLIGEYHRGDPEKKINNVDFLLAKFDTTNQWENTMPNEDVSLVGIDSPIEDHILKLHGRNTVTSGKVKFLQGTNAGKYVFYIELAGNHPVEGDSGAPWFTNDGRLVGMHLGVMPGNMNIARAINLNKVMEYYHISLA